jgi:DNA polymerase-3 subunit alpha
VKQVFTKKDNSPMAFVTLEDETAMLDVVVFPKTYELVKDMLVEDVGVLITGKVDFREEKINLMANEISRIEELPVLAGFNKTLGVVDEPEIAIPRGTSLDILKKINELLKKHPGDDTVYILVPNGGAPKRLKVPYPVDFDGVKPAVAKLLNG